MEVIKGNTKINDVIQTGRNISIQEVSKGYVRI